MEYVNLGKAGVKVSRLCLGSMNFGRGTDEAESIRIIHRALESGINFIDTANIYAKGRSEEIVGKAIRDRREQVVLATKVYATVDTGPNDRGNSRYHILQEVERSLKRLGTDHIDLYYLHRPDPDTPLEESIRAMSDLIRQGKIRYWGTSTFPAWQLAEAQWIAASSGEEAPVAEQPPYNILDRQIETEVIPCCEAYEVAVLPWSPLKGGWLTGKYGIGAPFPPGSRAAEEKWEKNYPMELGLRLVEKLKPIAAEHGVTLSRFALAWTLAQPAVTAPILGPATMEQFEDNLQALAVEIAPEALAAVDALVPPGFEIDAARPLAVMV